MQSLNSLIRLSKFQLDEKQRKLSEIRELLEQIQVSLRQLEQEVASEAQLAGDNLEARRQFMEYHKAVKVRRDSLMASALRLEEEVAHITNDIAACFEELKRYEITRDDRVRESRKKSQRGDTARLDEAGLQAFRRSGG